MLVKTNMDKSSSSGIAPRTADEGSYADADRISLSDFLAMLWRGRRAVAAVTALSAVLGVGSALIFPQYKSEGFLQFGGAIPLQKTDKEKEPFPGISLSDYKRYAAAFNTSGRFAEFVAQNKLIGNPEAEELRKAIGSRDGVARLIDPVYPFTKLDAKELGGETRDGNNNVIGLRISYTDSLPQSAQKSVALLGRYTMDTIIYLIYSDALRFKHTEMNSKITLLDNEIIDNKERLEQYRRKGESLKQIVTRYPESASQAARQIVAVTPENARYLSPVTQLMTSEVETSDANEAIHRAKREQQQSILLREYYDRAKALLDGTKSGETILRGLEPIKVAMFKDKDLNDETVKEVFNTITIDNQNALNLYLEKSRFIAGPSLPENRAERLSRVLAISLLIGLFISIFGVIASNWWKENRLKLQD